MLAKPRSRFNETPEQRAALIAQIIINGLPLSEARWLQADTITRISAPNGLRMIVYTDSHSPNEHQGVLRAQFDFADWFRPHLSVDNGDFLDFAELARFAKNIKDGTPFSQSDGIASARRQLREKMKAGNPALLFVTPGNHDDRERRYLSEFAPLFGGFVNGANHNRLTDLATNLLNFKPEDNIMFSWGVGQTGGKEGGLILQDYRLRHGNIVDSKPGYSAYRHVLKSLDNIGIGHVHRSGDFAFETAEGLVKHGEEFGCAINWDAPGMNYVNSDHDWTHAFGVVEIVGGIAHVQVVTAIIGEDASGRRQEYFSFLDNNFNVVEFPIYES